MTKEEYKAMCQEKANIKNYEYVIAQAEKDIEDLLKKIEIKKSKIANWQEKIKILEKKY